jgi:hypothetical protein
MKEKKVVVDASSHHRLWSLGWQRSTSCPQRKKPTSTWPSLVRNTRVVESSDPVNYRWENGRLARHEPGKPER